ncbi:MAG: Septin-domain-containing protein [Piptocephalis tieghemiana]|nr:MAG: Septin-domain-containing protein [Piptocephalis tieghemiana]
MPSSTNSQPSTDSQSQQVSSSLRPSTSASTATTSTTATSPPTSPVKETHTNSRSSSVSSSSSSSSSSDSPPPPLHLLPPGPTTSIRPVNLIVQEGDDRFSLTLVDTPGFIDDGTVEEQCRLLLTYLENQFDARLIEESRVRRSTRAIHTQMHACLYFLDPAHVGLRPVDILAIRHLSLRVNVIPILAMADTLTSSKLRRVKRAIRRDIISHSLQLYPFPALEEDEEDRDGEDGEAGVVVDSSHPVNPLGRTYPWGRVNVLEPLHCDFSALRTSLLLSHRTLLREVTIDVLYEKYRTERMRERRATMIAARQSKLLG